MSLLRASSLCSKSIKYHVEKISKMEHFEASCCNLESNKATPESIVPLANLTSFVLCLMRFNCKYVSFTIKLLDIEFAWNNIGKSKWMTNREWSAIYSRQNYRQSPINTVGTLAMPANISMIWCMNCLTVYCGRGSYIRIFFYSKRDFKIFLKTVLRMCVLFHPNVLIYTRAVHEYLVTSGKK